MGLLRVDYYPSLTEKQLRPLPVMKPLPMFNKEDVLKVYRLYPLPKLELKIKELTGSEPWTEINEVCHPDFTHLIWSSSVPRCGPKPDISAVCLKSCDCMF